MNHYRADHNCRYCGKDCSHHNGRILDDGFVFCDTTCHYLYENTIEFLSCKGDDVMEAIPAGE